MHCDGGWELTFMKIAKVPSLTFGSFFEKKIIFECLHRNSYYYHTAKKVQFFRENKIKTKNRNSL